jgi:REP element-mobilizing transposase RayT
MSDKYTVRDTENAYFLTITTVGWIDLFTRLKLRNTIIDSLKYCQQNKSLEVFAFVLMPSHLHLMCRSQEGHHLSDIIRDFKKFTSKCLIENIMDGGESRKEWLLELFRKACSRLNKEMNYKVWQDGYHGEPIESNKFIYQKLNYIHRNPVVDRIVEKPEDYIYSSARNYASLEGVMDVIVLPHKPLFLK